MCLITTLALSGWKDVEMSQCSVQRCAQKVSGVGWWVGRMSDSFKISWGTGRFPVIVMTLFPSLSSGGALNCSLSLSHPLFSSTLSPNPPLVHFRSAFPSSFFFLWDLILWRRPLVKSFLRHSCALCRWYAVTYYNPFKGIVLARPLAHARTRAPQCDLLGDVRAAVCAFTARGWEWVVRVNETPLFIHKSLLMHTVALTLVVAVVKCWERKIIKLFRNIFKLNYNKRTRARVVQYWGINSVFNIYHAISRTNRTEPVTCRFTTGDAQRRTRSPAFAPFLM